MSAAPEPRPGPAVDPLTALFAEAATPLADQPTQSSAARALADLGPAPASRPARVLEPVAPIAEPPRPTPQPMVLPAPEPEPELLVVPKGRAAKGFRARKVLRIVRHVEPWSVLKVSLLFYLCLWIILMVAGVILWGAAASTGTIDNVENFVRELFGLKSFEFVPDQILRGTAIGGLILVVALTGLNVLITVLFNLISDLTGGVRVTVIEVESARRTTRGKPTPGKPARAKAPRPGPTR